MRVLFLGNNWVAWKILNWLKEEKENIVGLVVHPPERRRYGQEIINSSGVDPSRIFDGSQLRQPEVIDAIRGLKPEIGISALFGFILRREFLDLLPAGCVNVHTAYLPHNRGAYPNVWSIIDGTPAGATIHYVDEGIDTGDIIAQAEVKVEPTDTGKTLYRKLEKAAVDLFKDTWPLICSGQAPRVPQAGEGTYHRLRDVESIDEIHLDRKYKARELIDLVRARTFPPYPGAYFQAGGRKVYMRLQLLYENRLGGEDGDE
jgi:methionyl-tRNA formyltransferase